MIEPYNLSQEQRDAARIKMLEKQISDLAVVLNHLAVNRIGVYFNCDAFILEQNVDFRKAQAQEAKTCAVAAAQKVTEGILNYGELYEKLALYEQWFHQNNHGGRSMR